MVPRIFEYICRDHPWGEWEVGGINSGSGANQLGDSDAFELDFIQMVEDFFDSISSVWFDVV